MDDDDSTLPRHLGDYYAAVDAPRLVLVEVALVDLTSAFKVVARGRRAVASAEYDNDDLICDRRTLKARGTVAGFRGLSSRALALPLSPVAFFGFRLANQPIAVRVESRELLVVAQEFAARQIAVAVAVHFAKP